MLFIRWYYVRDRIGLPLPVSSVIKTLVGGGISLVAILSVRIYNIVLFSLIQIISAVILVSLFYSLWILRTGTIDEEDLKLLERSTPLLGKFFEFIRKIMPDEG